VGRVQIKIATNGLEAQLVAAAGPAATIDELRAELANAGVTHGISENALDDAAARLTDPQATLDIVVARGTPPEHGRDGCLTGDLLGHPLPGVLEDSAPKASYRAQCDLNMNYRERLWLRPVATDQKVADITEPTAGTPGTTVRGQPINCKPGRPHAQREGDGVRRTDDALFANRDGVILSTDRKIDVVPLYTHSADVDYESGNLHTHGSLLINGEVCEGFHPTADADVAITGAVQNGGVTAGASVMIGQGVLGLDDVIRAGAKIRCRHATSARLVAEESIEIEDQSVQARLCAPRIRITEGRGTVLGGELHARDSIVVANAGSNAGTTTLLAVGELLEDPAEAARRTATAARIERTSVRSRRGDVNRGSKDTRARVRTSDKHSKDKLRLRERQLEILKSASIRITDTCQIGVIIRFGGWEIRPDEALKSTEFRFDVSERTIVQGDSR